MLKITRAVISVSDKAGIAEFARFLSENGVEIVSTGGTAELLGRHGVEVVPIREITGNDKDDYFDGRMKTISFRYESALLYRRDDPRHAAQARELGIPRVDLVVCNLYPFEKATAGADVTVEQAVENIDIGGPCMVRAAAKNHEGVAVVVNPERYAGIMEEMRKTGGCVSPETRRKLAAEAFERTADYDAAIGAFFADRFLGRREKRLKYTAGAQLGRYAENWHQKGWLYKATAGDEPGAPGAEQLMGGALGYNNYLDAEAALATALEFPGAAAVSIIKHANPCGLATGAALEAAFERAWQGDPVSAFGSVIAVTVPLDVPTARLLADRFVEVLLAPSAPDDVIAFLAGKKSALRVLAYGGVPSAGARSGGAPPSKPTVLRAITGGLLEQERDDLYYLADAAAELFRPARPMQCPNSGKTLRVGIVTKRGVPPARAGLVDFALRHVKHVKSNAITIAREYADGYYQVLGMGCGQPNRRDSVALAGSRAVENLRREFCAEETGGGGREAQVRRLEAEPGGALEKYLEREDAYVRAQLESDRVLLVSDAFFPFRDGLDNAAATGVKHVVAPGGSVRDDEVIAAAEEHGIAMIFTGVRKFFH
ncbi:MAG: bifunctional phosphoribosylaminoimidazolecarboxamide formyltransferase/IMP cyclohydrolase [bacterium]